MSASLPTLALPRITWATLGFAALAAAVATIGPWAFALWLLPDLALVAAHRLGRMAGAARERALGAVVLLEVAWAFVLKCYELG